MNFKIANLLKFILGFGIILAVITLFLLIIGGKDAFFRKHSTASQEESKKSGILTPSDGNRLRAAHLQSDVENQPFDPKKQMIDISNLERAQSRLSERIAALESKLDELKEILHSTDDNNLREDVDHDRAAGTYETEEDKNLLQIKAQTDLMQETLQSEPVDMEWSDLAIKTLHESVHEKTSGGLEIFSADCRSTFCRVDLTFDPSFSEEGMKEIEELAPWNGETACLIDINTGTAILYIAREEHSLPKLLQ